MYSFAVWCFFFASALVSYFVPVHFMYCCFQNNIKKRTVPTKMKGLIHFLIHPVSAIGAVNMSAMSRFTSWCKSRCGLPLLTQRNKREINHEATSYSAAHPVERGSQTDTTKIYTYPFYSNTHIPWVSVS